VETLVQVVAEEPAPPRRLRPGVPRDLETICLRCLEKEPARRYASAADLADDLGRFLRGEPVQARPVGRLARLGRWCRRNPSLAAVLACAFIALGAASGFACKAYQDQQAHLADKRRHALELGLLAVMSGDTAGAARAIDEAESFGASPGQLLLLRGQFA